MGLLIDGETLRVPTLECFAARPHLRPLHFRSAQCSLPVIAVDGQLAHLHFDALSAGQLEHVLQADQSLFVLEQHGKGSPVPALHHGSVRLVDNSTTEYSKRAREVKRGVRYPAEGRRVRVEVHRQGRRTQATLGGGVGGLFRVPVRLDVRDAHRLTH